MAIEVVLEECDFPRGLWFVVIRGIPGKSGTHVAHNALSIGQAKRLKARVEAALTAYGQPEVRPPPDVTVPSAWQRLVRDDGQTSPQKASRPRKRAEPACEPDTGTRPAVSSRPRTAR